MRYERKSEYGGYLPLELNSGTEMFERYSKYLKRFNSVKASFQYIIEQEKTLKIMIPYYYCPSTTEALKQSGVDISFYHISSDLCPEKIPDEKENLDIAGRLFRGKDKRTFPELQNNMKKQR